MKRWIKLFRTGRLALAWFLLALAGGRLQAASTAENRAFEAARGPFEIEDWGQAEKWFGEFLKKYPDSERYTDAVLMEAQARFKLHNHGGVIELLTAQQNHAGAKTDQFIYWMAEANYYSSNYQAAADQFARLAKDYPASTRNLDAMVGEAEAHRELKDWKAVVDKLGQTNGAFQEMVKANSTNALAVTGLLLLSEAQLEQSDYPAAAQTLGSLSTARFGPELEWKRGYLTCRIQLNSGQVGEALEGSTNLLALAAGQSGWKADSVMMHANILEQLGRWADAVAVYETNLEKDLPADRRDQALLKVIELTLKQNQTEAAAQKLEDFLIKYPEEKSSDLALLTLGELYLKQYDFGLEVKTNVESALPAVAGTNWLEQARTNFDRLINVFTNSQYLGKAQLNLGWCLWFGDRIAESQPAFSNAVRRLPFSEDQAVARFKLADAQYQQRNFAAAVTNYSQIISQYDTLPSVREDLFEPALYQILRAGIVQTNLTTATNAMEKLLAWYPNGPLTDRSVLLAGQAVNRYDSPARAREIFSSFKARFLQSKCLPEVELAIARTFEKEGDWRAAITNYDFWVTQHTNDESLPRAEFFRAWANSEAGLETNAFSLFTNFVPRFQTNLFAQRENLAARAQHWVGDFWFSREEWVNAEKSYQEVAKTSPGSDLAYQANMMAGRAARAYESISQAISYFTNLTSDPKCPPEFKKQALYAFGDAKMDLVSSKASASNYNDAISIFNQIVTTYTNESIAPRALGRIGDCYRQLAGLTQDQGQYDLATNAYQKVIDSPVADATTRSIAEVDLGVGLEAMARLRSATERDRFLKPALDHYKNVYYERNLRDGEQSDPFWIKQAGLAIGKLEEEYGEWNQAAKLYEDMQKKLPPLRNVLEKNKVRAQENLLLKGN